MTTFTIASFFNGWRMTTDRAIMPKLGERISGGNRSLQIFRGTEVDRALTNHLVLRELPDTYLFGNHQDLIRMHALAWKNGMISSKRGYETFIISDINDRDWHINWCNAQTILDMRPQQKMIVKLVEQGYDYHLRFVFPDHGVQGIVTDTAWVAEAMDICIADQIRTGHVDFAIELIAAVAGKSPHAEFILYDEPGTGIGDMHTFILKEREYAPLPMPSV